MRLSLWAVFAAFCVLAVSMLSAAPNALVVAQNGPGLMGGMSTTAITKLINNILPAALEMVKATPLEDISGRESGFNYEVRSIKIKEFNIASFTLSVTSGVRVDLRGIYGKAGMDWKYKLKKWPHLPKGSGTADATMDVSDIGATFALAVTADGRPSIRINEVTVDIHKITIKTHGSLFSWLYNLIIKAFQGTFKRAVEKGLKNALETTFNDKIAAIIATLPMAGRVGKWGTIDLHIPAQGLATIGDSIVLAFNGEVYPQGGFSDGLTPRHAGMPFVPSGRLLDIVLDTFTLQSAFHTYAHSGMLNKLITRDQHPEKFPDIFNTDQWTYIPALKAKYPNHDVRFVVTLGADPTVNAVPGALTLGADFRFDVQVSPVGADAWVSALKLAATGSTNLEVSLDTSVPFNPVLHLAIPAFNPKFAVTDSTIGNIDLTLLNIVVNALLNNVILPGINVMLADGIPLPSVAGLTLSNAEFNILQDGFQMRADVDFNI